MYMLDVLVGIVGHLLCVFQLGTGVLVSVSIGFVDFVQLMPLVIEMHAIVTCSHAHFRYLVGFVRMFFPLYYFACLGPLVSCWHCTHAHK
jgi:hypothetical protein